MALKGLQFFNLGCGVSFEGTGGYSCTLYDCQFIDCSNALAQADSAASVNVFNALFCDATNVFALGPAVASPQVSFQHVTVDGCQSLISGLPGAGTWMGKNSLFVNVQYQGSIPAALRNSSTCRTLSASSGVFITGGDASHYLTNNTYRGQGTLSIDATLLAVLSNKTTRPPMDLPLSFQTAGTMTFAPQVARYTNGANPDLGYYYDALDYTISDFILLDGGQLNILPGTAIGLRYDWFVGFDLYEGSCFNSQGMPNRPNIFAPVSSVQEGPVPYLLFAGFQVSFIPNYWPEVVADPSRDPDYNPAGSPPPELNFRFSNLYLAAGQFVGVSFHTAILPRPYPSA